VEWSFDLIYCTVRELTTPFLWESSRTLLRRRFSVCDQAQSCHVSLTIRLPDFSNFDVTFGKYVTCWVLALLQKQFCYSQHIRAKVLKRLISNRILDRFCDNSKAPLRRSRKINMEKISDDETLSRDAIKISAIASEYISSNLSFSVYIWNLSYYFAIQ